MIHHCGLICNQESYNRMNLFSLSLQQDLDLPQRRCEVKGVKNFKAKLLGKCVPKCNLGTRCKDQ